MNLLILIPVVLGFILNIISYAIYKLFLEKRLQNIVVEIEILEKKLESIRSEKRRARKLRLKDAEIKSLYGSFKNLMFLQMITLLTLYFIGFIVVTYIPGAVYFPFHVPGITYGEYNEVIGGYILVYILSFFVFVPLGSRRPKIF